MTSQPTQGPGGEGPAAWAVRRAEELIGSLAGVLSTRIVADRAGGIEEIHVSLESVQRTPELEA